MPSKLVMPHYSGDEIAVGVALAVALHAIPALLVVMNIVHPLSSDEDDKAAVATPVIAANLLKLGKPLDPNQLPDRLVPHHNTAPKHQINVSRDNPKPPPPDAGAPPPDAKESDQTQRFAKNDPFAEDGGPPPPDQGSPEGIDGGTETDPSKVHAGDMYAAKLGAFFHQRWQIPTVISQADASKLCVVYQVNISPRMFVWHLREMPIRKSGNDLFDDSARSMLQKLLDERTTLPEPPPEVADQFAGRTVNIALAGDMHGDTSRCR